MLYCIAKAILQFFLWPLRLRLEGGENIPAQGPVIIAANHISNWDPIVVALSIKRPICFIAKAELFNNVLWGYLLKKVYAFPVKRGTADRQAIRHALTVLEQNNVLGIFPEGQRQKDDRESKTHSGIAMLALKSHAPVVPVACIGTDRNIPWGWVSPLIVRVGKPIYLQEYWDQKINSATMEKASSEIMKEINNLLSK